MRLKRVELSNIRSHEHIVFEPEESGVTAIKGPTGAGKSTIVDSVPWALFGTKPPGVSRSIEIYREGAEFPDDRCFARIDLALSDTDYRVTRKMLKGGGTECLVEKLNDEGDYEEVAGPAVSHAEEYIRKLMKMSEKGFLSAVFVQQKQVDNLISASPRERGEIIEKLTGIHGLTHSLTRAREDSNSIKKAVSISTINENTVDELQEELDDLEESKETLTEKLSKARIRHSEARDKLSGDEVKLTELRKEVQRRLEVEGRLDFLVPHHERVEASIDSLKARRQALRERYLAVSGVGDLQAAERAAEEAREESNAAQGRLYPVTSRIGSLEAEIEASKKSITDSAYTRKSDVQTETSKLEDKATELADSIAAADSTVSDIAAEKRSLRGAKKALEKGEGTCPTCLQTAHDPVSALREIAHKIDQAEADEKSTKTQKAAHESDLVSTRAKLAELNDLLAAFERKTSAAKELKDARSDERDVRASVKLLSKKATNADKVLYSVKQAASIKDDLDEATKSLESAIDDTAKSGTEIQALKSSRDELTGTSPETLEKSEAALGKLRERAATLSEGILKIEGRLSVLEERHTNTLKRIEAEKANYKRYKDLLKSYEEAEASVSVISDFRQDRIDNSVPAIENLASLLLERFTDGLFVSLKLDSKFRVRVTRNDSAEFNVGLLSGGELSASAMALRLAVGMLLSPGETRNLLILDEVLTAQDSARSELILNSVRELYEGQVIIIAHNDSIDSIVDSVFAV